MKHSEFGWCFRSKHFFLLGIMRSLSWRREAGCPSPAQRSALKMVGEKEGFLRLAEENPFADKDQRTVAAIKSGKPGKRVTKPRS